jgi:thiol-disulfide isomerase/thioredoxin
MKTDPNLIEVLKNYEIIILDYDLDKDAVRGYNIKTLPTFIILEKNKEIKRKIGYQGKAKDLNKFLR